MSARSPLRRRNFANLLTRFEYALFEAHNHIERMPEDDRLTQASIHIAEARDLLADYTDEQLAKFGR